MGLFGRSKSHLERLEEDCKEIGRLAVRASDLATRSHRGQYEYMGPEERADLYRESVAALEGLEKHLDVARERRATMEADGAPGEELLTAESLVLSAGLDHEKAAGLVGKARESLITGMAEIEEFYGARSREARQIRRVLADLQDSA